MPDDKKKRTEGYIGDDGLPRDEHGNVIANPTSDANPDDLTFSEWFAAERRNNPNKKVGTWKGKQYKLVTKEEQSKKKSGGRLYKSGGRVRDAFTEQYD